MKKIYSSLVFILFLLAVKQVQAQSSAASFATQHDTVAFATAGAYTAEDGINNTTSSNITIQWKVIASNFPSDWVPLAGMCDNMNCFTGAGIWPSGTAYQSAYPPGMGSFHMTIDLSTATTLGTYYMKVKLSNYYSASDTAIETFIVSKTPAAVPVVKTEADIALYPNPATNELNIVYDASADIKTIAVYSIIGKLMTVYKVSEPTGANLNLESTPSGIYFARLVNSHGDVVATRRFTKQ